MNTATPLTQILAAGETIIWPERPTNGMFKAAKRILVDPLNPQDSREVYLVQRTRGKPSELSDLSLQIVYRLAQGKTQQEIVDELCCTPVYVQQHANRVKELIR